uniref:Class A beta-lactamase-related serine hydrolase n=1 Tax=Desulfacinum infernum TaxID=35837 RepID=A0A832A4C7_9BACT
MTSLERVVSPLFQSALADGVFSGACLLVAVGPRAVFSGFWGAASFEPDAERVGPSSLFDLASLTKPMATATLFMIFVSEGHIQVHDPLSRFFPRRLLPQSKRSITVEHLLSHRSGLPPYRPYFRELIHVPPKERKDVVMGWILQEPLMHKPGFARLYSDLGYLLLGWILEEVSGTALDGLFAERIRPAGKPWFLGYRRMKAQRETDAPIFAAPQVQRSQRACVATERCPWRGRLLRGEVHDENAWCLNGVAGHAGLFGSVDDVWQWAQSLLRLYGGERSELLATVTPETARFFMEGREFSGNPLDGGGCLGFDRPSAQGSSAGRFFSSNTVGHLGFTGTSFWMDVDRAVTVILLTNRVHPHRDDERIRMFRPLVHDKVMELVLSEYGSFCGPTHGGSR